MKETKYFVLILARNFIGKSCGPAYILIISTVRLFDISEIEIVFNRVTRILQLESRHQWRSAPSRQKLVDLSLRLQSSPEGLETTPTTSVTIIWQIS